MTKLSANPFFVSGVCRCHIYNSLSITSFEKNNLQASPKGGNCDDEYTELFGKSEG